MRRPNLVLVGFMGAGKSSVGRRTAETLQAAFVDADALIEAKAGMDIPSIFAAEGESGFRAREREVLFSLADEEGLVIATGGGAFQDPEVRARLKACGLTVYLEAPFAVLWDRIGHQRGRPLLAGDDAEARTRALHERRQASYSEAHVRVRADEALEHVVAAVVEVYRDSLKAKHDSDRAR